MTEIVFVARLHKLDKDRLGFYVPSNVSDYYEQLTDGELDAAMSWHQGGARNIAVKLYRYNGRLRGVLKDCLMPDAGTLVLFRLRVGE